MLLQPIDGPGAVLGAAGPCLVRNADFLSLYGIMFFDIDDLDFLEQIGFFDEVVIHEMGHVLGFGTLWEFGRDLLDGGGFLNSSASANPLSEVSAASMGDLGYVVKLGTGDRYRLPRTTAADVAAKIVTGGQPGLDLKGRERLIKPVAVVR